MHVSTEPCAHVSYKRPSFRINREVNTTRIERNTGRNTARRISTLARYPIRSIGKTSLDRANETLYFFFSFPFFSSNYNSQRRKRAKKSTLTSIRKRDNHRFSTIPVSVGDPISMRFDYRAHTHLDSKRKRGQGSFDFPHR